MKTRNKSKPLRDIAHAIHDAGDTESNAAEFPSAAQIAELIADTAVDSTTEENGNYFRKAMYKVKRKELARECLDMPGTKLCKRLWQCADRDRAKNGKVIAKVDGYSKVIIVYS